MQCPNSVLLGEAIVHPQYRCYGDTSILTICHIRFPQVTIGP